MFGTPAEAYDLHVGRYGRRLATALTDFSGIDPGASALDVGCGPGALTVVLAERLGAEKVRAVDPSERFVKACRARRPGVEVVVARAEALPFADGAVDAAFSQLVVNFMSNPEEGVLEMARVVRPGGIVASCVWDYAGEMTLLRAFWDAALETALDHAAVADEGMVMRWCAEGDLPRLWSAAGLHDIRASALVVNATYADFSDLWSPFPTGVGPSGAYCQSLDKRGLAALRDRYRDRLGVGNGPFELSARAWAVVGMVGDAI